jgi:hypothetical protein
MKEHCFKKLCEKVVSLHRSIRFAGIANSDGKLLAIAERKGLRPLLTPEERAQYAITAATRQYTRLRWEQHLGKIRYASSHYAKLIRATIPITDINSYLYCVILVTLDADTDNFHEIITRKIAPEVQKNITRIQKEITA